MANETKDIARSIADRLSKHAKEHGEEFQSVLVRYGSERFLYRLSISKYADRFLLKGAALFTLWFDQPHRPTKDIDLLGYGNNDIPAIEQTIKDICSIEYADGLQFDTESITGEEIREDLAYQGVRVKFTARLGNIRIPIQIDIGTGDAVTPGPENAEFPALLDLPSPTLKVYPKETVVAEKFEAMVRFGMANGRMKDFWDLRYMIEEFEFDGALLQKAIDSTFERRNTQLPGSLPIALTDEFIRNKLVNERWTAFIQRNGITRHVDLSETIAMLAVFFEPFVFQNVSDLSIKWDGRKWV